MAYSQNNNSLKKLVKKLNVKSSNIKEGMQKKYGTGEYARSGSKFKQRMKPGESKFKYNIRMKKTKPKTKTKSIMPSSKDEINVPGAKNPSWAQSGGGFKKPTTKKTKVRTSGVPTKNVKAWKAPDFKPWSVMRNIFQK